MGTGKPSDGRCAASAPAGDAQANSFTAQREQFLAIANLTRDAMLVLEPGAGRVLAANTAALEMFGYTLDEMLAMEARELHTPETAGDAPRLLAEADHDGGVLFESFHRRKDGSALPVEVSARGATFGGDRVIVGTLRDIRLRKEAEQALRASDEQLQMALSSARMGAWQVLESGSLEWSPRCREIFGVPDAATVSGIEAFMGLVHPDDRELILETDRAARDPSGSGRFDIVFRCVRPDGSIRWVSSQAVVRFAEVDGVRRFVGLIGILHDVTDWRELTSRLAAERERLAVTLRSIGDAVIATDPAARITVFNPVAEDLTGWKAKDAIGRDIHEVFRIQDESSGSPAANPVDDVLQSGVATRLADHTSLLSRTGISRPVADSAAPIRDSAGHLAGAVLVFRDQTRERRVRAALIQSRAELFDLIEKLTIGVFVERHGRIAYANPTFAGYLGYANPSELVGSRVEALLHHERSDAQPQPGEDLRRSAGQLWSARSRDGRSIALESSATREIGYEGQSAKLWVVRDLTDLKALHAQLMQSDRLASVGMLAAGVAHEINNPLAYLVAALEFLGAEFVDLARELPAGRLAEAEEALADAREGAGRVQHVVRDLKTFSRAQDERQSVIELAPVIESSINMAFNEIKYRARLVREFGKTPPVLGNESRLGQVVLNLLINAAQAIPEGNVSGNAIRLVTRTDAQGRAVVEVHDTGSGIPADIVGRIFDPFFTTKPQGVGTGLGLAICRNIVKAHGGDLAVQTRVGEGTTFTITLPPAPGADEEETVRTVGAAASARRCKVLVIDDEPAIGGAIRRLLSTQHDVVVMASAKNALERIAEGERFDAILCDLMMPEVTGMDVHAELQRVAPDQCQRMILLTGGAFTANARAFLDRVPNPRLEKPFDPKGLAAAVASVLERRA